MVGELLGRPRAQVPFSFRYFQTIEQNVTLPADFEPVGSRDRSQLGQAQVPGFGRVFPGNRHNRPHFDSGGTRSLDWRVEKYMDTGTYDSVAAAQLPPLLLFSDAAARKVGELIREEGNAPQVARLRVRWRLLGFQYGFTFDENEEEGDTRIENQGVKLLVDPTSIQYLAGAEIDYKEDLEGAQFVIRNPNATTTCGCGSSFAPDRRAWPDPAKSSPTSSRRSISARTASTWWWPVTPTGSSSSDRLREMVRLAAGLDDHGRLNRESVARALPCLERFGQRLRDMRAERVRVVGTNTLRKARRKGAFLDRACEALGHPIEIISGAEEARLIYLGAAHTTPSDAGRRLVVDIGGGSTELIIGEGLTAKRLESLYMGC